MSRVYGFFSFGRAIVFCQSNIPENSMEWSLHNDAVELCMKNAEHEHKRGTSGTFSVPVDSLTQHINERICIFMYIHIYFRSSAYIFQLIFMAKNTKIPRASKMPFIRLVMSERSLLIHHHGWSPFLLLAPHITPLLLLCNCVVWWCLYKLTAHRICSLPPTIEIKYCIYARIRSSFWAQP